MSDEKNTRPRIDSHFKVALDDAERCIRRLEDVKDYDDDVSQDTLAVTAKTKLRMPTLTTPIVPSISLSSSYELHGKVEDFPEFSKVRLVDYLLPSSSSSFLLLLLHVSLRPPPLSLSLYPFPLFDICLTRLLFVLIEFLLTDGSTRNLK